MDTLSRRQVRYWLFRFHTEATGGDRATGAPKGLKREYEKHPHFGGWDQYGVTWDVADDPKVIVPLRYSLLQQWNSEREV
jgi:hypothetical protein